jgi:hypothetical protein
MSALSHAVSVGSNQATALDQHQVEPIKKPDKEVGEAFNPFAGLGLSTTGLFNFGSGMLKEKRLGESSEDDFWLTTNTDKTIYFFKNRANTRCEGTNHEGVNTPKECKDKAVEYGHEFVSYTDNWGYKKCTTSENCEDGVTQKGWQNWKRWHGVYNLTHGELIPRDGGNGVCPDDTCGKPKKCEGCATQVDATLKRHLKSKSMGVRNHETCTSCKPGYVFVMKNSQERTGMCKQYERPGMAETYCLSLDNTQPMCAPQDKNVWYMTAVKRKNLIRVKGLETDARDFFTPLLATEGKWYPKSFLWAMCQVHKQVVCLGGKCDTHTENECVRVCRANNAGKVDFENCDASYCEGAMGDLACHAISVMA